MLELNGRTCTFLGADPGSATREEVRDARGLGAGPCLVAHPDSLTCVVYDVCATPRKKGVKEKEKSISFSPTRGAKSASACKYADDFNQLSTDEARLFLLEATPIIRAPIRTRQQLYYLANTY